MPVTQAEKDALDRELAEAHGVTIAPKTYKGSNPVGSGEAALRGFGSGLTFGFQPQIAGALSAVNPFTNETYSQGRDIAAQRNEEAWQQRPGAYASGYTGGIIAPSIATAGIGDLATALSMANKGYKAVKGTAELAPFLKGLPGAVIKPNAEVVAGKVGDAAANAAEAAGAAYKAVKSTSAKAGEAATKEAAKGPTVVDVIRSNTPKVIPRVIGGSTNQPDDASLLPRSLNPLSPAFNTPLSQNEEPASPFGRLTDFLAQARESANPEVQAAAEQAQATINPIDPDSKRKAAMLLASSDTGRAVSNSDSPLNEVG